MYRLRPIRLKFDFVLAYAIFSGRIARAVKVSDGNGSINESKPDEASIETVVIGNYFLQHSLIFDRS